MHQNMDFVLFILTFTPQLWFFDIRITICVKTCIWHICNDPYVKNRISDTFVITCNNIYYLLTTILTYLQWHLRQEIVRIVPIMRLCHIYNDIYIIIIIFDIWKDIYIKTRIFRQLKWYLCQYHEFDTFVMSFKSKMCYKLIKSVVMYL